MAGRYLYHATHRHNLVSILQHGLRGGEGYDPVHLAVPIELDPEDGMSPEGLIDFIHCLYQYRREDCVVLIVRADGLPLDEGWDGEGTAACGRTIEPNRIMILEERKSNAETTP
jgi:hypothetical protein